MAEFEVPETPESERERAIGLIIATIAVILAIVSAYGHGIHQDEILAHVDAADQYSFYQAKKDRHEQLELSTDAITLQRDHLSLPGQNDADRMLAAYATEEAKLDSDSQGIKAKGDELLKESQYLARRAGVFDLAEIGLQISVVLCSISILTGQKLFVRMGLVLAVAGVLVALWGCFLPR